MAGLEGVTRHCGRGEIGRRWGLKHPFLWSTGSSPVVRTNDKGIAHWQIAWSQMTSKPKYPLRTPRMMTEPLPTAMNRYLPS